MATLIAYASERGSTKEVAERIAMRLASDGIEVKCLTTDQIKDINGYRYIIVGSAVHNFTWLPRAEKFLQEQSAHLKVVPVWGFSVGYPGGAPRLLFGKHYEEKERPQLDEYVKKMVPCRSHVLFNGRLGLGDTGKRFTVIWAVLGGRFGDRREWDVIEKWADEISGEIKSMASCVAAQETS